MAGIGQKVKEKLGLGAAKAEHAAERATGHPRTDYAAVGTDGGACGTGSYETRNATVDVPVVQQTTTTTAAVPVAVATEAPVAARGEEAVCSQEHFVKVEDRPVVKERVEQILEHRPVEKEFVVETRATGVEREITGGQVEHLGTTERIVSVTPPSAPCDTLQVKETLGLGEAKAERAAERTTGHPHHAHTGVGTTAERPGYTSGVAGGPAYAGTAGTEGAYGERGYGAEGYETRTATVDVPVVQKTTTTTAAAPMAGEVPVATGGAPEVCQQDFFTKESTRAIGAVEDRPVVKERVEQILEHRPVEKEFVVETRATGVEREIPGGEVEHLGTTERIVSVTPPSAPCE
ncbi:hypothetical protein ABPG75_005314 [Micractinium tetrahymenae]